MGNKGNGDLANGMDYQIDFGTMTVTIKVPTPSPDEIPETPPIINVDLQESDLRNMIEFMEQARRFTFGGAFIPKRSPLDPK